MTNLSLAEKVEGLAGPCRETDGLIARALGWTTVAPPRDSDRPLPHLWVAPDGSQHMAFPPHWTGSLDAVCELVEVEMPAARLEVVIGSDFSSARIVTGWSCAKRRVLASTIERPDSHAAICAIAAFLRAKGEQNG